MPKVSSTIFASLFNAGVPAGSQYYTGVTEWAKGATAYRGSLAGTYDAAGDVVPAVLQTYLQAFPAGTYVAFDMEEQGYNDRPSAGGNAQQIAYIQAAKAIRSDLFYGYYSSFVRTNNALVMPEGGANRTIIENLVPDGNDLAAVVDFIAPQVYVSYVGPIKDAAGNPLNGVTAGFASHWLASSSYGFDEWKNWYDWKIGQANRYGKPVYPYFAPYTLLNQTDGAYKVPLSATTLFQVPFFTEMVRHIQDTTEKAFWFDIAGSSKVYTQAFQNEVVALFNSEIPVPDPVVTPGMSHD